MKKETINASDLRKRVERHRRGYRNDKFLGLVFVCGGVLLLLLSSAGRHSCSVAAHRANSATGFFFWGMGLSMLVRARTTKVFDDYLKLIERDRGKEQDVATSP